MNILKLFRKRNKISQIELADHLGVTQGFISQMENGTSAVPDNVISRLLANTCGWETEMLIEEEKPQLELEDKPRLSDVEILLRDMLAEKDAKIDTLNEVIWELKTEIGRLQEQIRILNNKKGNDASDAGSGIANVG